MKFPKATRLLLALFLALGLFAPATAPAAAHRLTAALEIASVNWNH